MGSGEWRVGREVASGEWEARQGVVVCECMLCMRCVCICSMHAPQGTAVHLLRAQVSVGVATSKTLAKWASIAAKPPRTLAPDGILVALRGEPLRQLLRVTPLSR